MKKNWIRFQVGFMVLIQLSAFTLLESWCVQQIFLERQSLHWPKVTGQIMHSTTGKNPKRLTDLFYRYSVNGQTYYNDVFFWGVSGKGFISPRLERTFSLYPAGKSVLVSYKPDSPGVSCLQPGRLIWSTYLVMLIMLPCLCLAWWTAKQHAKVEREWGANADLSMHPT